MAKPKITCCERKWCVMLPLRVAVYAVAVAGVCGGGWLAARRAAPEKNDTDARI
jgi:hypothetical protein